MEFIKLFDFIGEKPKLFFNSSVNHKTKLGGILSILSFNVLLAAVIFFTNILLERSNFNVMLNEQLNPDSSIDWTKRELSITVVDKLGNLFPDAERIYGITGSYFWSVKNGTDAKISMKLLNTEKCSYDKHFSENNDLWRKENSVIGGWCLEKNQKIITQKPFGATNFSNVVFWVHMCKNTTTKNDCYPEEKIKSILLNAFTVFKLADVYFDHNDKDNTAKPFVLSDTIQTSITVYKRIFYTFKNIDYYSDANYILTDNTLNSYVSLADSKEAVDLRPLNTTTITNSFLAISLTNNIRKQVFYRRYYKAQNLMADIGGIIKAILLIATIINNIFVERLYYTDIINYNLSNMNVSIERMDGKLNVLDMSINGRESKLSMIKQIEYNNENPVVINVKNRNKISNHKIEFPIYVSCIPKFLLPRKNNYRHVFDKLDDLTNLIKKQLDIKYIISKLNNVDKLSFMFFGKEYYNLLEGAPNPYIQDKFIYLKDFSIDKKNNESESINTRLNRNYNTLFKIK